MLELIAITKAFGRGLFASGRILDEVSLDVAPGEMVGLIGESGCGKSTLARIALKLIPLHGGKILLDGLDVTSMSERAFRPLRKNLQIVFQHPETALNPSYRLHRSLEEAFSMVGIPRDHRAVCAERLAEEVGLPEDVLDRYPDQVSGGEIQRVAVARVLAMQPRYVVLDEPTSMLDASVQALILLALLKRVRRGESGMLLISHDLELVRAACDRVAVMRQGCLVEEGPTQQVFMNPRHEYTWELLSGSSARA